MIQKRLAHYFFLAILILLLYLSFLIIKPYATYILLALVLSFSFYPTYKKLEKILRSPNLTATIMILFIILIIVIPVILVASSIISQASNAYNNYDSKIIEELSTQINERLGTQINLTTHVENLFNSIGSLIIKNAPGFVGGVTDLTIGFFIMFVGMFYLFKKGHLTNSIIMKYLPLKEQYKKDLIKEVKAVTHAVVYSQIIVSLVQGILLGISFAVFGLPNPIFWGFIATILSFLPVVGAPLVWIPGAVIKLLTGSVGTAIGILLFNGIITMNIDNFMRPRIVSNNSRLHPFITLIGIIGGLKIFGFIGILLGPSYY